MWKKRVQGWHAEDGTEYYNCHLNFWYPNQVAYPLIFPINLLVVLLLNDPHEYCLVMYSHNAPRETAGCLVQVEEEEAGEDSGRTAPH